MGVRTRTFFLALACSGLTNLLAAHRAQHLQAQSANYHKRRAPLVSERDTIPGGSLFDLIAAA
jgi:hypothetical protein